MVTTTKKHVAIIGAGPSGLTAAKAMLSMGHSVTVFEASGDVGGHWNAKSELSGVWQNLCMNTNRRMIEFSDFPWQEAIPEPLPGGFAGVFACVAEVKMYLSAYADTFNLRPFIRLNSRVTKVTKISKSTEPDQEQTLGQGKSTGHHWVVETTTGTDDDERNNIQHDEFDAIAVCSGRYTTPNCPLTETGGVLAHFAGQIVHSCDYNTIEKNLEGKRVLVIGNSISGTEIASEAVIRRASAVFHTMRGKPKYILPTVMRKPSGYMGTLMDIFYTRMAIFVRRFMPPSWIASAVNSLVSTVAPRQIDPDVVGPRWAMHPIFVEVGGAATRRDYVGDVNARRIVLKSMPVKVDGCAVTFGGGGGGGAEEQEAVTTEDIDIVIMATGFRVELAYLPESVRKGALMDVVFDGKTVQDLALYKHTLHPTDPSVFFIGLPNFEAPHFPAAEMQSRFAAAVLSGHVSRPSDAKIRTEVDKWKAWRMQKRSHSTTNATVLEEDIGDIMGLTPSYLMAFWYFKLLVKAPLFPVNYRLKAYVDTSDQTARDAWARLNRYVCNPTTPVLE